MVTQFIKRKVSQITYRKWGQKRTKDHKVYKSNGDFIIKLKKGNTNDANIDSFHREHKNKSHRDSHIPEKISQHYVPRVRTHQLDFNNRRQFINTGGFSMTTELIFSILIISILFIAGFFMGYNFSLNRSTSLYGTQESATHHSLTNTDSKSIATSSNSSVTNTNNDADTITNTVSSG